MSRRKFLLSSAGLVGAVALGGCARSSSPVAADAAAVRRAEAARRASGARVVSARLHPQPVTLDLGGPIVRSWAYGQTVPGPLLRVTAGEVLRAEVVNALPADTSVHWHGIALRNDMDGVPGLTQDPIRGGESFTYEFTAPDPGTYFYHPHVGIQLDRGLYGVLIVDDPHEPGGYDAEWLVVLDDWVDGTGRTPDEVLAGLAGSGGAPNGPGGGAPNGPGGHDMGGAQGMTATSGMGHDMGGAGAMAGMGAMGATSTSPILGGAGDVTYPYYLVNGRIPAAPEVFRGKPGQRVRIRVVNAGSDTAFRLALGGHSLRVTHSDGFPVQPVEADAVVIGMGERFDLQVTLGDGVFPLVALAEGKAGAARALVRTGSGTVPAESVRPRELDRRVVLGNDLRASPDVLLPPRPVQRSHDLVLAGSMAPYRWTINGATFAQSQPLPVRQGERVLLRFANHSGMFHPMHVHGHTFALPGGGARKDTVIVRPMQTVQVELEADNPGQWATHCHNIYHAETGMMVALSYRA